MLSYWSKQVLRHSQPIQSRSKTQTTQTSKFARTAAWFLLQSKTNCELLWLLVGWNCFSYGLCEWRCKYGIIMIEEDRSQHWGNSPPLSEKHVSSLKSHHNWINEGWETTVGQQHNDPTQGRRVAQTVSILESCLLRESWLYTLWHEIFVDFPTILENQIPLK